MNKMTKLQAMQEIIRDLEAQVKLQATGHIRTSINVLREEERKLTEEIDRLVAEADERSRVA
jgi:galactokinase/mevalonate kinase-like predicted kinase